MGVSGLASTIGSSLRPHVCGRKLSCFIALILGVVALAAMSDIATARPNLVIIVSDDHQAPGTMDTPAMAKTKGWFQTGQLPGGGTVAGGTVFPNGVVTTPLCCPSRSSIVSGRYAHNTNVQNNNQAGNFDQTTALQRYLKLVGGYRTGIFGKYMNGLGYENPPSDHWDDYVTFDGNQYFPTRVNDNGTIRSITDAYSTDYFATRALQFLQDNDVNHSGTPWLLYLAPATPHAPFIPAPLFANAIVPPFVAPPSYLESDRRDKPTWVQNTYEDDREIQDRRANQIRMLYSLDSAVDAVMQRVKDLGQEDNTLAFFIGDNGMHWGEHGLVSKASPYTESFGVPFYMRWPGTGHPTVAQNHVDDSLAANIDIAPTALDAAGVTPPAGSPAMDGRSLFGPSSSRNRILGEEWSPDPNDPELKNWRSLRTKTFQYIYTPPTTEGTPPVQVPAQKEYYDLTRDPNELTNLLKDDNPENDPPTDALQAQLDADFTCTGSSCPPAPSDPSTFPPDTAITVKPDANTNSTNAEFVFTSSEPTSSFECRLDGAVTWSSCGGTGWPYATTFTVSIGSHTLEVRATAPDGTSDSSPASHSWTVDATPDTALGSTKPAKLSNQASAQFSFSGTGSGFECERDGLGYSSCTSPQSYSGLTDGVHTFNVRAISLAISDPTPATYTWTIDTTKPTASVNQPSSGSNTFISSSHTVLFRTGASEPLRGRVCKLARGNPSTPQDETYTPCGMNVEFSGIPNGSNTFTVKATDYAGNESDPTTKQFTVDAIPTFNDAPDTAWPDVGDAADKSEVRAIIPDGAGGWYIGGDFTQVGGQGHADLAHIKSDKTVESGWAPSTNGRVEALALSGQTLFVGGTFTNVNGTTRNRVAALSTTDGSLTSWDPNTDGPVNDIAIAGGSAYLVGAFGNVGGAPHARIAEVSSTGAGAATAWAGGVTVLGSVDEQNAAQLNALQVTSGTVYVGGTGTFNDGSTTRHNLFGIDRTSGQIVGWAPEPHSNAGVFDGVVNSLQLSPDRTTIFAAGNFNYVGGQGALPRGAAEIQLSDGEPTLWRPGPFKNGGNITDITPIDITLPGGTRRWSEVLSGSFGIIKAWIQRFGLAEVSSIGPNNGDGWPTDWLPSFEYDNSPPLGTQPAFNPIVYDTAVSGSTLALAGKFEAIGFDSTTDIAFFEDPAPNTTITGRVGGTLTAQHVQIITFSSSEPQSTFECKLDAGAFSRCGSGGSGFLGYFFASGLSVGDHTFQVRARDSRGTLDPTPDSYSWTIQDFGNAPESGWPYIGTGNAVRAIVGDRRGGWYVGGEFESVCDSGGVCDPTDCTLANHCHLHHDLVHINADKTVDDAFNPTVDPTAPNTGVRALALDATNNKLYVAGSFTSMNGNTDLAKLARINATTGQEDTSWVPNVNNWIYGIALSGNGTIYIGGTFTFAGGQARGKLAEIDLTSGMATSWNPDVVSGPGPNAQVLTIALSATKLYAGGMGIDSVGSQTGVGDIFEVDRSTGSASSWNPTPNGPVNAVALRSKSPSTVYAAGPFSTISATTRNRFAELNLDSTASPTAWDPDANAPGTSLAFVYNTTIIGGMFTTVHGLPRSRLAQTLSDGSVSGWQPSLGANPLALTTQARLTGWLTLAAGGVFQDSGHRLFEVFGPPDLQ